MTQTPATERANTVTESEHRVNCIHQLRRAPSRVETQTQPSPVLATAHKVQTQGKLIFAQEPQRCSCHRLGDGISTSIPVNTVLHQPPRGRELNHSGVARAAENYNYED